MSLPQSLLTVANVSKTYSARVLTDVNFELRAGEVHALVGENGAGKSTLARIIAGLTRADAGELRLRSKPYAPTSKVDAEHRGVRLVMQELNLVANLSVAENIFFDQLPNRFGWIDYPRLHEQARRVMAEVGLDDTDPSQPVRSLGVGHQQLVEIAAGLSRQCAVLVLDEPTAALTNPEIDRLFLQIRQLQAKGVGVIYVSHRLEEIRRLADRVTVLRDGVIVETRSVQETSIKEIVHLMVGRDLAESQMRAPRADASPALRVRHLVSGSAVRDVSFDLFEGEILGFAGLMGSGRTETVRAIFGADLPQAGEVFIGTASESVRIRSPRDAVQQGIALLTEDRKNQGLLLPLPIRVNTTVTRLGALSRAAGWIQRQAEAREAERWVEALRIRCRSAEQPVGELSGGNQQKVVIAKWLFRECRILLFDEPTRGIDVGAKFEIYEMLGQLCQRGKAVLVVSSDLKELMALCDRIAVMSAGRIAAVFTRNEWTEEKIMTAALSGYLERQIG